MVPHLKQLITLGVVLYTQNIALFESSTFILLAAAAIYYYTM